MLKSLRCLPNGTGFDRSVLDFGLPGPVVTSILAQAGLFVKWVASRWVC